MTLIFFYFAPKKILDISLNEGILLLPKVAPLYFGKMNSSFKKAAFRRTTKETDEENPCS